MAFVELCLKVLSHVHEIAPFLHHIVYLILKALHLLRRGTCSSTWLSSNSLRQLTVRVADLMLPLTSELDLFLQDDNLLQLRFNHLLELKNLLVTLFASQYDIKLSHCRFILIQVSLHQRVIIHERLRTSDLFKQEVMQT